MNRMSVMTSALVAVSALTVSPAQAHDFKHGAVTIAHPFVRADPACDGDVTRAYVMLIINQGKRADRLLAASLADGVRGTFQTTIGAGAGGSRSVNAIDLPASGRVALMPPAYVIEFPVPSRDLQKGAALQGSLQFEHAGTAKIDFMIEVAREPGRACGAAAGPAGEDKGHHHKH